MEAQEGLKEVEGEIDKTVAGLYGITDEELEKVRKTLGVLREERARSDYYLDEGKISSKT